MKNRKALLSGYTDLQFSALLAILLVVFAIMMSMQENALIADAKQEEILWEAGWLANSYAQYPVEVQGGKEPLIQAIRNGMSPEEIKEELQALQEQTKLADMYPDVNMGLEPTIFVIRDGKGIVCLESEALNQQNTKIQRCASFKELASKSGPGLQESLQHQQEILKDIGFSIGWTVTPEPSQTLIGVVVG